MEIVEGVFNHKLLRQLQCTLLEGKVIAQKQTDIVAADAISELVATIKKVKYSARSTIEWHMYTNRYSMLMCL